MDMHKFIRSGSVFVALTLAYLGLAYLGVRLASLHGNASPVWPAAGFGMFAVLAFGRTGIVAVCLGTFLINFISDASVGAVLSITCGNTLEACLGAYIIRRVSRRALSFEFHTHTFAITLAAATGAVCSASVGVVSLVAYGVIRGSDFGASWITWWIGNFLGALIVAPACWFFYRRRNELKGLLQGPKFGRLFLCLGVSVAGLCFVFLTPRGHGCLFLLFPILLLSAWLLDRWGIWLVMILLSASCIALTTYGWGPFSSGSMNQNLIHLQLFLVSLGLTALTLAGMAPGGLVRRVAPVMLLCWCVFGALLYYFDRAEKAADAHHFSTMIHDIESDIVHRVRTYEDAIRAGVGLYAGSDASDRVNYREWKAFFRTLDLRNQFPGIVGVGVTWPVKTKDLVRFQRELSSEGLTDFELHSIDGTEDFKTAAPDQEHYIVKYIEPLESGHSPVGLIVSPDSIRKSAADMSRDTGLPTITESLQLIKLKKQGFLLYLPIFKPGQPTATLDQRRRAHLGWVHAPIIAENFFAGSSSKYAREVELHIFDGGSTAGQPIYSSTVLQPNVVFEKTSKFTVGQREFTTGWRRAHGFVNAHDAVLAWTGLCGALLTLFLVSLIAALESINAKSLQLAKDLTMDLSRSEARQAEALNMIKLIINNVPALIAFWDNKEICQFANRPFARWHGIEVDAAIGKSLREIVGDKLYPLRFPQIQWALQGKTSFIETSLPDRETGELRCFYVHYIPHREESKVLGFFVVVIDVTELKNAEMVAVEEKQRAIAASQIKSQFLANMSHEIRTPLNAIIGMTGLLMDRPVPQLQRDYLEAIGQSADNLLTVINNILDVSKIEAGKLELEAIEFDPRDVLNGCVQSLKCLADEKNLSVQISIEPTVGSSLIGDPARLAQILNNLIGNAIKFTSEGAIVLRIKTVNEDQSQQLLRFEVEDSGIGIPADAHDTIFHPFTQVDPSTTRRFGGTGLGLSICRQLVELMDGEIGLTSELGRGSRFWIEVKFPRGKNLNKKSLRFERRGILPAGSAGRILLAEDNPLNQTVALAQLSKFGFEIDVANDGREAVAALEKTPYDLVLMDCHMPNMDGYEAARSIRAAANAPYRDIPIIAITAHASSEQRNLCLNLGMNDFLSKPVEEHQLFDTIEKWMPPIDRAALDRLLGEGNPPDLLKNLVQVFVDTSPNYLAGIDSAVREKSGPHLFEAAHRLKSGASQLGARNIVRTCARLEQLGRGDAWMEEAELLSQNLHTEFREACASLAATLRL